MINFFKLNSFFSLLVIILSTSATNIGVYYFPGWSSKTNYWGDIQGLPNSRSPNISWENRKPLIGYYDDTQESTMMKQISIANQYKIDFFAFDWYWNGSNPQYDDAIKNFININNSRMKFALMWANHSANPQDLKDFESMVIFWNKNYFSLPNYYRIGNKPVVFIFSPDQLIINSKKFGSSSRELLNDAIRITNLNNIKGIYFIALTNSKPSDNLESQLKVQGYSAYSGWNYVVSQNNIKRADYDLMVQTYINYNESQSMTQHLLPFIPSASPGWDSRPWAKESQAIVRYNSTSNKFKNLLCSSKQAVIKNTNTTNKIVMIEAWNEFGEGSYIEPTEGTGFGYLQAIKDVFYNESSCK